MRSGRLSLVVIVSFLVSGCMTAEVDPDCAEADCAQQAAERSSQTDADESRSNAGADGWQQGAPRKPDPDNVSVTDASVGSLQDCSFVRTQVPTDDAAVRDSYPAWFRSTPEGQPVFGAAEGAVLNFGSCRSFQVGEVGDGPLHFLYTAMFGQEREEGGDFGELLRDVYLSDPRAAPLFGLNASSASTSQVDPVAIAADSTRWSGAGSASDDEGGIAFRFDALADHGWERDVASATGFWVAVDAAQEVIWNGTGDRSHTDWSLGGVVVAEIQWAGQVDVDGESWLADALGPRPNPHPAVAWMLKTGYSAVVTVKPR